MIDAKDWMTDTARYRNEEANWEAHRDKDQDDQEFHRLRLALAETDISATKAAHLAAREAYVAAYNEAYDKAHREFYPHWRREFVDTWDEVNRLLKSRAQSRLSTSRS